MALRNHAALGVQNGMRATVLGLGDDGGLRVASDAGALLELPTSYLSDGHLTYGYAITVHKAQGMTVDRSFVLGSSGIDRQWAYTALSRARLGSRLYLALERSPFSRERDETGGRGDETGSRLRADECPFVRLARDLARDRRKEAAIERDIDREPRERGFGLER